PVRIIDRAGDVKTHSVRFNSQTDSFQFDLDAPVARIDIDPEIELFRLLDSDEKPTTFSNVFAAPKVDVIATDDAFAEVANKLSKEYSGWNFVRNSTGIQDDSDVIFLLGPPNNSRAVDGYDLEQNEQISINVGEIEIEGIKHSLDADTVVAMVDTVVVEGIEKTVLWVATVQTEGLIDFLKRLRHYGRYSYAVFETPDHRAAITGQWHGMAQTLSKIFDPRISIPDTESPAALF
ncbi:MAG: hypothetical protein OER96_07080, partial [Gammaproteobacteria bacterium]|nr:hypothetical protein [Gammaproteobacteria bacterium]